MVGELPGPGRPPGADRRRGGPQGLRVPELVGRSRTAGAAAPTSSTSATRARPQQVGFIPAPQPYYHGEGAHVVSDRRARFKGDILAVNDETYGSNLDLDDAACAPADTTGGGFDLYDVTDPANPVTLVQGAGDRDPDNDPATPRARVRELLPLRVRVAGRPARLPRGVRQHRVHRRRHLRHHRPAGAGAGRRPRPRRAVPADPRRRAVPTAAPSSTTTWWSSRSAARPILKADYWDAGYVQLDVTDPANPTLDQRHDVRGRGSAAARLGPDAGGQRPPGRVLADNQFLLAADEDFGAFRNVVRATSGPTAGRHGDRRRGRRRGARSPALPDETLNGPSVFVGDGCDPATRPGRAGGRRQPGHGRHRARRARRRRCRATAPPAASPTSSTTPRPTGWDGADRLQPGPSRRRPGEHAHRRRAAIPGVQMRRVDAIGADGRARGRPSRRRRPAPPGPTIVGRPEFDGWGYAHLYDAKTGEELDAYAIPEALDPRFATGFGDLSIHEFATDPTDEPRLQRLLRGRHAGVPVQPRGRPRADGRVDRRPAARTSGASSSSRPPNGERLIAGSDRDFGLVILRYTGPGAVGPTPAAAPPSPAAPSGVAAATPTRRWSSRPCCAGGRSIDGQEPAASGSRSTARRRPEGRCVGTLRVESGRTILIKQRFRVTAGSSATSACG